MDAPQVVLAASGVAALVADPIRGRFLRARATPGRVTHGWTLGLNVVAGAAVCFASILSSTPTAALGFVSGTVIFALGSALRFRAQTDLGQYWSPQIEIRTAHQVVTRGLYAYVRHPAYLGHILQFLGFPLALGSRPGLAVALLLGLPAMIVRSRLEDRALVAALGPSYAAYRTKTLARWRRSRASSGDVSSSGDVDTTGAPA